MIFEKMSGDEQHRSTTVKNDYITQTTSVHVPHDDIVSFILGRYDKIDGETRVFVDARDARNFITYSEAHKLIYDLAAGLCTMGVKPKDCVCIHSYNDIRYPLMWLATVAAGGITSGCNPGYTTHELIHHFEITDTKFIITQESCSRLALEAAQACHISRGNVFIMSAPGRTLDSNLKSFADLLEQGQKVTLDSSFHTFANSEDQRTTIACYATTSGTTGLPKAAELSHLHFVSQVSLLEAQYLKRQGPIIQLHTLPVFHAFAAPIALLLPLRLGITTYLLPRFDITSYLEAIDCFQITDTAVVPPIIATLLKGSADYRNKLQSLRYMTCAGAPLSAKMQRSLSQGLHRCLNISQVWGCTELGRISAFGPDEYDDTGSVGRLVPNTVLKLVDNSGKAVTEPGVRGEAFVKSLSMFRSYRNCTTGDNNYLSPFDHEGFYATGDIAYVQDGKVYIDGRVKDVMKVNGWQVSPEEVREVIMELGPKGIEDCAVVGVSKINSDGLEITMPKAFVVKALDSKLNAADIKAYVKNHLVSYKQLTGGVTFVDRIPRNSTGKIPRILLEHLCAGENNVDDDKLEQLPDPKDNIRYYVIAVVLIPLLSVFGPLGIVVVAVIRGGFP